MSLQQVSLMKKANNNRWDNRNPRGTDTNAAYAKAVPAEVYARFERAEAAHKNAMENVPWFVGAVALGNWAGLSASEFLVFLVWGCFWWWLREMVVVRGTWEREVDDGVLIGKIWSEIWIDR